VSTAHEEISLKMMMRDARENPNAQQVLTDKQQRSLLDMVTKRCRQDKKQVIAENIARPLKEWPGRWAIERLYVRGQVMTYCTGQDWDVERAQLRKQLYDFR
jgi:hypothetical protein